MIQYVEEEEHRVVWCTATIQREGFADFVVSQGALKGEFFKADLERARKMVLKSIQFYLDAGACEGHKMKGVYSP